MVQGITIPVNLQILQSSLSELQKTLSTLKPNTTGFNQVKSIIEDIRKEIDSLAIQGSKPFISTNQFTRAEKSVNKIEESFARAAQVMSRVKFNDLALSPQQLEEYKQLQQNIDNIKNSIKAAKEAAKGSLLSGADTKDIVQKIDPSAATKTYDELIKEIQIKTKEVEKAYKEANNKLKEAEGQIAPGKTAEKLRTGDGSMAALQQALPLKDLEKFFTKNGNFKSGGSNQFAEYLKQTFSLSDSDITELRGQTAAKVRSLLIDVDSEINKALKRTSEKGQTAERNIPSLKADIEEQATSQAAMKTLNQRVQESGNKVEETIKNQKPAMEAATDAVNRWKDAQVNAAHAPQALTAASQQAASGLATLRNALDQGTVAFQKFQAQTNTFNSLKMAVANFMGFHQVLNLVKNGIREAANHIKELDSVMNGISIVTDLSTSDLWNQIDAYSAMAQRYGVSIKGAYEVSKIYYQQGLETADVMTLTNETLKLSKISGMDYAVATDYMTTAIRGFKMEMQDAATVVDVYSALAANTAVSQEELAIAMSKTASSMEGVGATFEEASAMIGTMVAVTRESATNIGSAMKSIASRYGELTKNPLGLADAEGEAYSFNKVDTALQSVGISMKTVDGQFRNFTDVIIELGEKWNELDSTQQRYIATQFAGNRQQSRFLALVSNVDTLKANIDVAETSEDTGTVQAIKSLDSIESKIEQVRVAYQQFYTSIGAEDVWKTGLDGLRNYIDTLNGLPKIFGKIPIGAVAVITDTIALLKNAAEQALAGLANIWPNIFKPDNNEAKAATNDVVNSVVNTSSNGEASVETAGMQLGQAYIAGLRNGLTTHSDSVEGGKATQDVVNSIIHTSEEAAAKIEQAGKGLGESYIDGLKETLDQIDNLLAIDTKYTSNPAYQKAKRNEDYYLNETGSPEARRETQKRLERSYGRPRDMYGNGHTLNSTVTERDPQLELWNAFEKARAEASPEVQSLINEAIYDIGKNGYSGPDYLKKIINNDPSDIRKADAMEAMRIMDLTSLPTEGWKNFERAVGMYGPTNIVKHERSVDNIISDIQSERTLNIGAYGGPSMHRDSLVYGDMPQLLAGRPLTDEQRKALETAKTSISSTIEADTQNKKAIEDQKRAEQARKEERERVIMESIKSTPKVEARDRDAFSGTVAKTTEVNPTKLASWDELKAATASTYENEVKTETDAIQQQIAALQALKQAREDVKNASTKEEKTKAEEARQAALTEVQKYGYSKSINGKQIDKEIEKLSNPSTTTAESPAKVAPIKLDVVANAQAATEAGQQAAETAQTAATEKPIEVPVKPEAPVKPEEDKSGQLAFDLENLGPENTITVPIEPIVDGQKMSENVQQAVEQAQGQITIDDLFANPNEEWEDRMTQEYEAMQEQFTPMTDDYEGNQAEIEAIAQKIQAKKEEQQIDQENAAKASQATAAKVEGEKKHTEAIFKNIDALDEEAKAMKRQEEAQKAAQSQKGLKQWTKDHSSGIRNTAYALSMLSGMLDTTSEAGAKAAGALQLVSGAMKIFSHGGIMAIVSGIISVINAIDLLYEDENEKLERLTKESQKLSDEAKVAKSDFNTLDKSSKKLEELKEKRYESKEASEEYQEAVNDLTSKFPELIASFDDAGNAILNESALTDTLTESRKKSAQAAYDAAKAEVERAKAAKESDLKEAKKSLKRTITVAEGTISPQSTVGMSDIDKFSDTKYMQELKKQRDYGGWKLTDMAASFGGTNYDFAKVLAYTALKQTELGNWFDEMQFWGNPNDQGQTLDINKFISSLNNLYQQSSVENSSDTVLTEDLPTLLNVLQQIINPEVTEEIQLQAVDEINNAISEMKTALDSDNDQDIFNAQKNLTDTLNKWRDAKYGLYDQITQLEDSLGDGYKKLTEYNSENLLQISAEKLQINSFLDGQTDNLNLAIANSGAMLGIITDKLYKQYQEFIKTEQGKDVDLTTYLQSFAGTFNEDGLGTLAEQWYNSMTENRQKAFETMFNNQTYYNAEDIIKEFGTKMSPEVQEAIKDYYTNYETNINTRLVEHFSNQDSAIATKVNELLADEQVSLTLGDENLFNSIQDEYENLAAYGTEEGSRAAKYAAAAQALITQIMGLDGKAAAFVEKTIADYGYSQEGLQKASDAIRAADDIEGLDQKAINSITGSLDNMAQEYVNSAVLRIQALQDEFTSAWKDVQSNLSSASSGMDISAAQKWLKDSKQYFDAAGKFQNLELTNLQFIDGQFYATAEQIAALRQGYLTKYKEEIKAETKILENARDNAEKASMEELAQYEKQVGKEGEYLHKNQETGTYELNEGVSWSQAAQGIKDAAEKAITDANETAGNLGQWLEESMLQTAQEGLKISEYLLGERTDKNRNNFKRRLQNVAIEKYGHQLSDGIIEFWASTLEKGGQAATFLAKNLYPDISEEELAKIYSAPFDNYSNVIKQLSEVTKGSVVTGELRKILSSPELGMADANGIVNDTFNMVKAYHAIYDKMRNTAGATTAGLNDVYAEMLTAEDQQNVDIIDTLKNSEGITYDALGKMLARYNVTLEEVLTNEVTAAEYGLERTGFGKVRLIDWTSFAKKIFNTDDLEAIANDPEYISAFKAYNDGLIKLNKDAEDAIVKEIKQIESAKAGDQINLTNLWMKLNQAIEEAAQRTDFNIPDLNGNVNNMGNRVIVSREAMQKMFPEDDYTGDYSTVYGQEVAFSEISQLGAIFANLTATGERTAVDIDDYASKLYSLALEKTNGIEEDITAELIKSLDAENENLIVDIQQYYGTSNTDEILDLVAKRYEIIHEAEENAYSDNQIAAALGKATKAEQRKILDAELELFDADYTEGILTIGDNANLLGIAQTLEKYADIAGLELGNGLEEVKDSILKVLKSYTDAITNGIKGGLSNTDASNLIKIAGNLGVNDLHFEQTTEGLKLSQQSAIELYQALAKVDALQGKIVFDKLAESLKKSNEHFATTSALLNRIADLTRIINGMRDNTLAADERVSDTRLEQYKAELEVAKEIVAVRSAAEDDSFNFMNNKIPAGQNNPLNYAKNWTKALKAIKEAYKVNNSYDLNAGGVKRTRTGYMGYEDFYNVINEINNMAGMMNQPITIGKDIRGKAIQLNGDLTSASDAIMAGIETLTAVDTGDMMINIGALGINLAKSGSELKKGIDKGIDAVADAQIKALDGMIAMLELIVQMEELGDIAGEDMVIELPDIVTDNPDFDKDMNGLSDNFDAWREKFLAAGSKSKELADAITINGQKMSEWLMRAANEWTEDDAAILNALYQAAISTDWNLDDIGGSLQQMLNSGKFGELAEGFTITLDDVVYTIQHGVVVEAADFSDKDAQEVLKQYKADHQNEKLTDAQAQTRIVEAIQKYLNGEGASDGLTVTQILKLRHNTLIKTDEKGNDYIELTGKDGKTQRYDSNTPQFRAAVQAQVLKDQGIDSKNIIPNYDAGIAVANVSYGIKTQTHFTVSANDDGTVEWNLANGDSLAEYATTGKTYRTQTDLLKDIYKNLKEAAVKGDDFAKEAVNGASTFESFIYLHYGIHLQIQTEVYKTGADGKPIKVDDPTKDPKLQKELKPYLNGEKKIDFDNNNEGKTTVKLDHGYTIQLDTDDISYDGSHVDQNLLRAKLAEIFGIDAGLKETISTAITEALTSLTQIEPGNLSAIGSALQTIASAISTLSSASWDAITNGLNNLQLPSDSESPLQLELEAVITSFISGEGTDPNELVNALKGIIQTYSDAGADTSNLAQSIAGLITTYTEAGGVDTSQLAQNISALITSYSEGAEVDTSNLAQAITGVIATYTDAGADVSTLAQAITGIIINYTDTNADTSSLASNIEGIITAYTDNEADKSTLANALTGIITLYDDSTSNKDSLVNALTGVITEYQEANGLEKPTLDDLVQFINEINTTGADAALATWRAAQEQAALVIRVATSVDGEGADISTSDIVQELQQAVSNLESDFDDDLGLDWTSITNQDQAKEAVINSFGQTTDAAKGAISNYIDSVFSEYSTQLESGDFEGSFSEFLSGFAQTLQEKSAEAGGYIPAGLGQAIADNTSQVTEASSTMGDKTIDSMDAALGVDSPSIYAIEAGQYVDEGLSEGITEGQDEATTAASELGTQVIQAIGKAINEGLQTLPALIQQSGLKEKIATEFESIGDYAADTFLKEFGTLGTQLANDVSGQAGQFKEAMKPAADAIASSMNEALAEFENRTVSTLGSVRSHWDTLVKNIIAAVAVIMALVQTMQQKISITWDIKTPLGNLAGEGSGNTEIAEALSAAMSGIQDILPALIQQWTEIAKSVTSGPDGIAPKLKIDTTDAETSLRSIKESLTTIQENANIDIAINGELDAIKNSLQIIAGLLETISQSSHIDITSGKAPEKPSTSKNDSEEQPEKDVEVNATVKNVDTSGAEGKTVELTAKISFEEIPEIQTTQTISTEGGVYDIPNFTTIQYIQTVKGKGPGGGCFIAGTQISMADGTTKNIEDIKVGDLVVAYDYKLKKFVQGKVNKAYIHHNTPRLIKITFSNNNYLILTPGHPLLSTKGWKSRDIENSLYEHKTNATWLEIGDEIIGLNDNLIVVDIQEMEVPKNYDTYNAEVETYHTFIANGLVAHNSKAAAPDDGPPVATGNVGLTKAKGTLMGELGPELVVSNGRYFVAGQNGPEMVDLSDDAIVFNHLQTESLLKKGMSNERGRAVTNERNAVAFATGNMNGGPAMASASAALAALKQLRAMWESLKSASVSDLAGAGGGGGGGGGGDKDKVIDPKAWVDTVERWFNLMQEIAALERQITHEETLRSKIQSEWIKDGKAYVKSQKLSLESIKAQIKAQEELNISRRDYFNKRIEALEKEPLGKLYTFDAETGKMQFKDSIINGKDGVMEFLTDLVGFDNLKGANHTNKEKYEILMAAGFGDYMKFDESGNEIKMDADNNGETTDEERESFYENTTKAFWSHIDEFKASTESLWESIAEGENKILELETSRNEIYQEMRDNQMELEDAVLAAIEDMKQREIDALSDEREALEDSTQEYIQGLTDALDKEREMYETQEKEDELNRKRRRLGILERSGASAADITSLQQEIDDQERDLYFDIQQQQIDAIQEASDKEIERLDNQIDIMTQQLEFQKEYGLLWSDVYQVMNSSAQQIASFIMNGNSEFWASSPLNTSDGFNKIFFEATQWKAYQEDIGSITDWAKFEMQEKTAIAFNTYDTAMKNQYGESYDQGNRYMKAGGYKEIFDSVYQDTADLTKATEAVRKTYTNHKRYLDREAQANSFGVPWKKDNGDTEYRAIDDNEHWAFRYARENINGVEAYYFQSASRENHSWNNGECSKCHHKQPAPPMPAGGGFGGGGSGDSSKNIAYYERNGTKYRHVLMDGTKGPWIEEDKAGQNAINFVKRKEENQNKQQNNQKKKAYASIIKVDGGHASGGYVGHGIYELGELGTETVLTAEQTQVLRNNILSNRPNSLISLLKSYNQGYSQISKPLTGITTTEDNSTTIEKVELNMNVQKIANDYDAKRAGEQALSEMLRIAKKTSAANSVRR